MVAGIERGGYAALFPGRGGQWAGGTCENGMVGSMGADHMGQGLGRRPSSGRAAWRRGNGSREEVRDLAAPGQEIIATITRVLRTSLVVQQLRVRAPNAGCPGFDLWSGN